MSKASDKLAKLAGFGMLAGAEPAAAAREAIKAAESPALPAGEEKPPSAPEKAVKAPTAASVAITKVERAGEGMPTQQAKKALSVLGRDNLTRNVVFLPADQAELDRIEDVLRAAGIRKPTIADLVRVALRAAKPSTAEAAELFQEAKALDSRRAENKSRLAVK
jgi:hypothetical protein